MSNYMVGPVSFGNHEPNELSGALHLQRPQEKVSPPCLSLHLRINAGKGMTSPVVFGSVLFAVSAQRRNSPTSRGGDVLRLPRCEASFDQHILQPGQYTTLEAELPLDSATIQKFDDLRGAEYGLHFNVKVKVRFSLMQGTNAALAGSGLDLGLDFDLTNDHWRELLGIWDWPRTRVFEVRASSFPNVKSFDAAAKKLIEAQRALEQADYQGSITLSREVIDAVLDKIKLDDHTSERHEKHGPRRGSMSQADFQQAGVPAEFWRLYVALTEIATAAEEPEGHLWSPHEARMMLAIAAGMAEHLGAVFQRARAARP